ncbi:MAG: hypothetical protein U1E62_26365 [Alsobacter sp.]
MELLSFQDGISFGTQGNASSYFLRGWASPQDHEILTWTVERVAQLQFRAPGGRGPTGCTVRVLPFLGNGAIPFQDANFYLNGLWFGFTRCTELGDVSFALPRDVFNPRQNILSVVIPTAASPASLGQSEDTRVLGLAFASIKFSQS